MTRLHRLLHRAGPPPAPPRIYLDPADAARAQRATAARVHVVQIPLLRTVGLSLLALIVFLHNRVLLPPCACRSVLPFGGLVALYAGLSWGLLYAWARRWPAAPLGFVLLLADLVVWTVAIYCTGGASSWLFGVLLLRPADQSHTTFRTALGFAHAAPLSYLLLLAYLHYGEHRALAWPAEWTKIGFLYGASLYLALTAKTAEALRQRLTAAIRVARELIAQLHTHATQLTEAKATAEHLGRTQALILQTAGEGIYGIDLDGQLTFVNPAAARLLGWDVEALRGQSVTVMLPTDPPGAPLTRVRHHDPSLTPAGPPGSSPQAVPAVFRRQDGTTFPVEYIRTPLYEEGALRGLVVTFRDMTERVQAEAALRAAQDALEQRVAERTAELEARTAELERFTYAVSHDLKSPLITIQGFLGLLEQDALRGDGARLRLDITYIQTAATTMQRLLDELLALSQIGRVVQTPTVIPLGEVAHEAVMLVGGRIAAGGVQVHIAPDLPVVVGDRPRLLAVLQNLVDNAVKFLGTQPTPRIEIGWRQGEHDTVYYVQDNGVGIAPQDQEKIFGLFERLEAAGEGTGIGLALVKRIIEVHGGHIWVESAGQGGGSTFCFTLPQPAPVVACE
jgi:two-component system, LuxR family, sensor kinase FixL